MRIISEPKTLKRSDATLTAGQILYWLLRGFTFAIAILLGLNILTAYVWIPFYTNEGYTLQFEDRVFALIGDCLLFIVIVVPHRWTLRWSSVLGRVVIIVFAVSWIVVVDIVAYHRRLSTMLFTPHGLLALLVATALLATLAIQFDRHRRT